MQRRTLFQHGAQVPDRTQALKSATPVFGSLLLALPISIQNRAVNADFCVLAKLKFHRFDRPFIGEFMQSPACNPVEEFVFIQNLDLAFVENSLLGFVE